MEEQIRVSSKKAIASLVCGIVAAFFPFLRIYNNLMAENIFDKVYNYFIRIGKAFKFEISGDILFVFIFFIMPGILGIIGLILGIKGLKSSVKIISTLGIILCIIAMLLWIYTCLPFFGVFSQSNI